jgi:hypothetical protein
MGWKTSGRIYRYHKLSLSQGLLEANIIERDGKIIVLIGQGLAQRRGEFVNLDCAKCWAIEEMRLALSQMQRELKPRKRKVSLLLYMCLVIYLFLGLVWFLFFDEW